MQFVIPYLFPLTCHPQNKRERKVSGVSVDVDGIGCGI